MNVLTYLLAKKKSGNGSKKVQGRIRKYTIANGGNIIAGDFVSLTGSKVKRASLYDEILGISRKAGSGGQTVEIYIPMGSE